MARKRSPMANNDWLTVQDAAKVSGYRADHLRELIRDGKVEAKKFGPIWAVNRQSLISYMNQALKSTDRRHGPKSKRKRQ